MKATIGAALLCLCASVARADFTYLAQSGSATVGYAIPTATPPNDSVSWSEPGGFVDYSDVIIKGPSLDSECDMSAKFHPTFISIAGHVDSVGVGGALGTTTGMESRSITFRNDTAQSWAMVGKLTLGVLQLPRNGVTYSSAINCTFVGSDGTNETFSPVSEDDFTGQIKPGITYTLSIAANESMTGLPVPTVLYSTTADFSVTIGQDLPEPPTLALALADVLVAMLLRRA